ncbi:MAG: apolipoprotein N-acyltransferase, partial [Proteobacteria bacterium]|nr:apolipoprotein N-acyltransferase [Pseudomonadota bacterium]
RLNFFLAASSGFLLTLSFPRFDISWLAWFAFIPLFVALRNLSLKNSFYLGLFAGLVHYLSLVYWLAHTMSTYGHLPFYVSIPILFLLSFYLALYIALFSMAVTRLCSSPFSLLFIPPLIWISLEYIRSFLFTGFPWELMGYTQFNMLHIIQISDLFGVYGVSFCIVLSNAVGFLIYLCLMDKIWQGKRVQTKLAAGAIAAFVVILGAIWFYGKWRINNIHELAVMSPSSKVTIVQGNIDQAKKWDPAFQKSSTMKYIHLSSLSKDLQPDLVVWPETATPFYFMHDTELSKLVLTGIHEIGADFLIGTPAFTLKNNKIEYYNSAFLVDAVGNVNGRYDKTHLVPFGEYVPMKKWLPFVSKMVEGVGDFDTGEKGQTIRWQKSSIGILICYEIIFPALSRAMVQNNASLLVNITNDAWYGRSSAPYQHFSMSVFRAVENRRSLVRAANTGISGFIEPSGRVIETTQIFKDAVITQKVPILQVETLYSRFGDVFAMACLGLSVFFILLRLLKFRTRIWLKGH